jgi:ABC-type Fe3+ transport system permease subunit
MADQKSQSKLFSSMKTQNRLRRLSISLSLVILALGFSALGFVSLIHTQPGQTSSIFSVEHTYSVIGSTFSVLVGTAFLVAAITFRGARHGSLKSLSRTSMPI